MAIDAPPEPCRRPRFLFGLCFDPAEASRMPRLGEKIPFEFVKKQHLISTAVGKLGNLLWWQEADV